MVARVGDDLFGDATIRNFRSFGIDTSHVQITPGVSSGVAPIFVDSAGQNRILVVKGANDRLHPADIDAAAGLLESADMIVMQLEVPIETVYYTLRFARERGIRTILNPAPGQPLDLHSAGYADYVIPNETEAGTISGIPVHDLDSARASARRLIEDGLRSVIITLGEKGALSARAGMDAIFPPLKCVRWTQPARATRSSGALPISWRITIPEIQAIRRANLYAALSTLAAGTQKSFANRDRFETEWGSRVVKSD